MGGKTGTTTSSVQIPKEVLARYNAVNAYASDVAKTPFQGYQGQFVAGLTPTQRAGIQATSQYSQAAQPYYQAATGQLLSAQQSALPGISAAYQNVGGAQDIGSQYAQGATQGIGAALQYAQPYQEGATQAALMGAHGIQPEQLQTAQYMNPYTQAVAAPTYQALQQQQQEQMAGQLGNAIRSGAFGGDRAALAAANLARQQQLGMAQAMAPIYQQGYGQALQTAQQQQGVQLGAEQANRAAMQNLAAQLQGLGQAGYGQQMGAAQQYGALGQQQYGQGMGAAAQLAGLAQQGYGMGAQTAQQLAGLGSGAQQAALQGAQAQLGAGTLEQQTQQADLTARYQQFLQERGYPFQVAQFLANIAMGTGALSGSTSTTTQPMPFFSDRRVKHDVKEIGETHDGQPIYSFKYNGDNTTQIGLMAQDVEKKHPDAVGEYEGVKTVDYKKATEDAERKERYEGGLVPASMGGAVTEPGAYGRGGYAPGGLVDPNDIQSLLAQQQQAFGPFGEGGIYGGTQHQAPYMTGKGIVPQTRLHTPKLMVADRPPPLPESGASQIMSAIDTASKIKDQYQKVKETVSGLKPKDVEEAKTAPSTSSSGVSPATSVVKEIKETSEPSIWDKLGTSIYDILGRKDGGLVPRHHYAAGGSKDPSLPYEEDDKSPYKYFPVEILEIEKPELQKPNTPQSQSGSGLSGLASLVGLGKTIIGFLPFADGGVVPRNGYEDGGFADLDRYLNAIAKIESSGNYGAIGPRTNAGDRAYGKYQVMGANVPSWTEEAIGKRMTPQEFLADKQAQEATARHHFGKALQQYGTPEDAASVWFSGRPMAKSGRASDITGTTVPEYINRFRAALDDRNLPARGAVTAQGVKPQQTESQGVMPGVQNWLTENQSWLSPLGAGLKGMVQSKSPFLGGALLEGIGSGLEALGPTQRQMAETALVRAQETGALAGLPKDAVLVDQLGRPYGVRVYINGKMAIVGFDEYQKALEENRPYDLAPSPYGTSPQGIVPRIEAPDLGYSVPSVGGVGKPPVSTTSQPVTTGEPPSTTPTPKAGTGAPLYREGSSDVQNIALDAGKRVRRGGIKVLSQSPSANPFDAQSAIAADAAKDTLQRNTLTSSLGSLPRGGSFLTSGAFGANVGKPVVDWVNGILTSAGADFKISKPEDLANAQVAEKISTLLATRRTTESGQRAYGALEQILGAVPSMYNTPEGQANLLADLYITQQREIDLDRFYRNVRNTAEKTIPGFSPVESQYMGQGLYDQFAQRMEQQYAKEKQDLQKLYMKPLRITDPNTNQVTETYILPYLAKTAGNIPEEVKQEIVKRYGVSPELFRYFSVQ